MYPLMAARNFTNPTGYSRLGERTDDEKAKDCLKYLLVLAEQRLPWEPQIDNLIAYVNHGRRFITDKDLWAGQPTGQYVFDDTAMLARNKLRDGMVGNLCSRNQAWFGLEIPGKFNFPRTSIMRSWSGQRVDSYPQVQKWLQDSATVMYSAFNRSNFYDVNTDFISDGASLGTATIIAEEDIATATIVFTVPHFRECFIAENQFGEVDTHYRLFKLTLRQLAQKFGWDEMCEVEPNFERDYKLNFHSEREVLHAVYPREDYQPWRLDSRGKKWASEWVYCRGGKILNPGVKGQSRSLANSKDVASKVSGYDSMPVITWRWNKNNDEVYGRGPAHDAWVSILKINQMARTNLITAQRGAEPPLVASSDLRNAIQKDADGITYIPDVRGDIRMRAPVPLYTGFQNLPFEIQFQDRVAAVINEHFYTSVFEKMSLLAASGGMSRPVVDQVQEIMGEKAAILGTRVGRLQSEGFNPIIDRVYSIEAEAGRIPDPPAILLEAYRGPVEVQYQGPLAQAQTRLTTVRSIQSFLTAVQQVAQFDPTIVHAVNGPQVLRILRDAVNAPVEIVYDEKTFAAILEHINKQAQLQREADTVPKLAKAAAALSKQPESGSILNQLMGGDNAGQ